MYKKLFYILIYPLFILSGLYSLGFVLFTLHALKPIQAEKTNTELAIVLTGGENRIKDAVDLLKDEYINHVFISGVGKGVTLKDIFPHTYQDIECCVSLGYLAQDTFGNAMESYSWLEKQKEDVSSFYLVTSSYHIPRAYQIFKHHPKAQNYNIYLYPTPMERLSPDHREFWNLMFEEYNKLLYTWGNIQLKRSSSL